MSKEASVRDYRIEGLRDLQKFGEEQDSKTVDRIKRILIIAPDTGQFLFILIRATGERRMMRPAYAATISRR